MAIDPFRLHAPILDGLPSEARLAFPFLQKLAPSGLSEPEIIKQVRAGGIDVGTQAATAIIQHLRGQDPSKAYVQALASDFLPNPEVLSEASTNTLRRYSYIVRVEGSHVDTGQTIVQYITVSTHDLMTKQDAEAMAEGYILGNTAQYGMEDITLSVENIQRNPLMPIG